MTWTVGRWLMRWLIGLAVCVPMVTSLTGCAWLDRTQRAAIYRPSQTFDDKFTGLSAGDEQFYLMLNEPQGAPRAELPRATAGAEPEPFIGVWWMPALSAQAPTVLYFHGVFRNLTHNHPKLVALREAGFSVLAVSYRGWPFSSPTLPSEQSIYEDAMRAVAELKRRQPNPCKRLLYGHSMGGGVAVEVASRLNYPGDYAGLMLESTFTALADVATQQRWYAWMLKPVQSQYFDSLSKIEYVAAPLLVRHGLADQTVPFMLGQRLFDAAPRQVSPRQWIAFEGGSHSGLHAEFPDHYRRSAWTFWTDMLTQPLLCP